MESAAVLKQLRASMPSRLAANHAHLLAECDHLKHCNSQLMRELEVAQNGPPPPRPPPPPPRSEEVAELAAAQPWPKAAAGVAAAMDDAVTLPRPGSGVGVDDAAPAAAAAMTSVAPAQMRVPATRRAVSKQPTHISVGNDCSFAVLVGRLDGAGALDVAASPPLAELPPGERYVGGGNTGTPLVFVRADTREEVACVCILGGAEQVRLLDCLTVQLRTQCWTKNL